MQLRTRLFSDEEWNAVAKCLGLPARQLQVVRLIAVFGRSDVEIARELAISVSTVRVHLGRAFKRLGVHDRTQLVIEVFHRFREIHG